MEAEMDKDIIKREEGSGGVLYEPAEPLFPDGPIRKRRPPFVIWGTVAATVMALICAVGIMSVYGESDHEWDTGATVTESDTDFESENERWDSTESDDGDTEGTGERTETTADQTGGAVESSQDEGTESYESAETDGCVVGDLSEYERGERYLINYSGLYADVGGMLDEGFVEIEQKGAGAPVVMIIHTHTSEEYAESEDNSFRGVCGVVSAGEEINSELNRRGLSSIHCTVIHDGDDEVNAYISARDTVRMMLEIYPSVKYVIDVHRLELYADDGREIKTLSKSGAAQIKLTVGDGGAWQDNLSFALALRKEMNSDGERLCMPVVLSSSKYNSDMSRYYIMVDVGTQANSVDEAMRAGELLADAIADVLLSE